MHATTWQRVPAVCHLSARRYNLLLPSGLVAPACLILNMLNQITANVSFLKNLTFATSSLRKAVSSRKSKLEIFNIFSTVFLVTAPK